MNWVNLSSGLFGGVIGALLGALAAWRIERDTWVKDCRKQEWRQLLDAFSTLESLIANYPGTSTISDSVLKDGIYGTFAQVIRTLNDRLFIPSRLVAQVRDRADEIFDHEIPLEADASHAFDRCKRARDLTANVARRDLGLRAARSGKDLAGRKTSL